MVCQRWSLLSAISLFVLTQLTSCTTWNNKDLASPFNYRTESHSNQNGSLTISRRDPGVSRHQGDAFHQPLGFIPEPTTQHSGSWLLVKTSQGVIELMNGEKVVSSIKGDGVRDLPHGVFKVKHKQRNPLWYAPDSYFSERALPAPLDGDKARYRRGALGDYVLFLDKQLPIHSGPIWLSHIGGVRVDETELSKVYYSLNVGSVVEVR